MLTLLKFDHGLYHICPRNSTHQGRRRHLLVYISTRSLYLIMTNGPPEYRPGNCLVDSSCIRNVPSDLIIVSVALLVENGISLNIHSSTHCLVWKHHHECPYRRSEFNVTALKLAVEQVFIIVRMGQQLVLPSNSNHLAIIIIQVMYSQHHVGRGFGPDILCNDYAYAKVAVLVESSQIIGTSKISS